jgi:hypothetical protein
MLVRLSEWRGRSPHKDSMTPKVMAVIEPVVVTLGADPDPDAWIVWGDDPGVRYLVLIPTVLGLAEIHVRVNVPQEGPRASGKLVRWDRVQIGELAIEMAGGHRILSFQVESQVLRGSDDAADEIAAFARSLIAAIDGRTPPEADRAPGGRRPRVASSDAAVPQLPAPREA